MTSTAEHPTITGIRLTEDDLLEGATRQYAAGIMRPRVLLFATLLAIGGFAFGAYILPARAPDFRLGLLGSLAVLAYFYGVLGMIYLVARRGVRRQWRENKLVQQTIDVAWNAKSYKVQGESANSDLPWSYYKGWRETPNLFLLYYSPVNYQILPKRYLSAQEQSDFRETVAAGGVTERKGLRS